jgi:hypothetical protein
LTNRFARQYRYDPPPDFHLASTYAGIVRDLSGSNKCAKIESSKKNRPNEGASYESLLNFLLSFRIFFLIEKVFFTFCESDRPRLRCSLAASGDSEPDLVTDSQPLRRRLRLGTARFIRPRERTAVQQL